MAETIPFYLSVFPPCHRLSARHYVPDDLLLCFVFFLKVFLPQCFYALFLTTINTWIALELLVSRYALLPFDAHRGDKLHSCHWYMWKRCVFNSGLKHISALRRWVVIVKCTLLEANMIKLIILKQTVKYYVPLLIFHMWQPPFSEIDHLKKYLLGRITSILHPCSIFQIKNFSLNNIVFN